MMPYAEAADAVPLARSVGARAVLFVLFLIGTFFSGHDILNINIVSQIKVLWKRKSKKNT